MNSRSRKSWEAPYILPGGVLRLALPIPWYLRGGDRRGGRYEDRRETEFCALQETKP